VRLLTLYNILKRARILTLYVTIFYTRVLLSLFKKDRFNGIVFLHADGYQFLTKPSKLQSNSITVPVLSKKEINN